MKKNPTKTDLLVIRAFIDMALAGDRRMIQHAYCAIQPFSDDPLYEDWLKRWETKDTSDRNIKDPEVLAMIEACKEWKSERDWVSAEADESQPVNGVARNGTFSMAQDALKPRDS